jgi:hypothetical protein
MPWRRMGGGCIDTDFLDLGINCRWVVNFTPQVKSPQYPVDRRLGGPPSRSGRCGKEKILDSTGTRTPTCRLSSPYPVAIPTVGIRGRDWRKKKCCNLGTSVDVVNTLPTKYSMRTYSATRKYNCKSAFQTYQYCTWWAMCWPCWLHQPTSLSYSTSSFFSPGSTTGARGSVVGWGTMLQIGKVAGSSFG